MVRYLKYIVIVFGSIGLLVGSFFAYQNRVDIAHAWEYNNVFELEYLQKNCSNDQQEYLYPCLKKYFSEYLSEVSLTGTNFGLKMVFSAMDEIKSHQTKYMDKKASEIAFALSYLELNNMALDNAYRKYFGVEAMYGGFVATLGKFYPKAFEFSENMILGLRSNQGLQNFENKDLQNNFSQKLSSLEQQFYQIKQEVLDFIAKQKSALGQ